MTTPLRPYPTYKDSGVPWLGQIPVHWELGPGFSAFREKQVKNTGMLETTVLSLSYGRIVVKPPEKLHGLVPASFETYQVVDPDDIIIRPTDLQNDWTSLRVGIARERGIITSAYICLHTLDPLRATYGYLLLDSYDLMKVFYGMGSGLRQNLDYKDLKRMPILIPPADEQAAIARYLDHADRRIRRYIRTKQRLIKLLNEQKQAIIHRAVTRGLDPTVPLKPSGVEWLGDVPEHWDLKRLKDVVPQVTVGIVIQPARLYEATGIPCLRSLNISSGKIESHNLVYISPENNHLNRKSMIFEGDIVVVRTGRAGIAAIVTKEFHGANCIDLLIVRKSPLLLSQYLLMYLRSPAARSDVEYRSVGAIQTHYNTATLANLVLPLPTVEEQQTILRVLEGGLLYVDVALAKAQREIDLMREYRTRLIADVVTGKLDVRAAAASLPDEVEEMVAVDEAEALVEDDEDTEESEAVEEGEA